MSRIQVVNSSQEKADFPMPTPPRASGDTESESADRDPLDLLSEEFLERRNRGEAVSVEAFALEHPEHTEQIRAVFPALLIMNDAKPQASRNDSVSGKPSRERIGEYRLIRVIGQGGMGVVYEAEHEALGRRVALKTLPPAIVRDPNLVERFRREARAAAGLHHTNIIPVFDVGQDEDICFYTMQYIEGRGLDQVFAELVRLESSGSDASNYFSQLSSDGPGSTTSNSDAKRQPFFRAIAKLAAEVADALAYAHERNIVHRDVKPSNLVLDNSGVVWLADFGLAKTDDVELTATGDFIGTARYMAPERIKNRGDHRADIYGLGMVLYELVTLRNAFDAADRLHVIEQIAVAEPKRPREINRNIPLDLETVVLKAMNKDPRRRYASAAELAADLRRVVDDQPIHARRASSAERVIRWVRRNKSLTAAMLSMAALIGVLIVSTVVIGGQRNQARQNLAEVERQKQIATDNYNFALVQKALAEDNFQLAFDSVDKYYTFVSEETLLNEPGMEPLRAKLVAAAVSFYEKLAQKPGGDSEIQISYIDALHRLGVVEDAFYSKDKAIEYFRSAIAAANERPSVASEPELMKRIVRSKALLGDSLLFTGQRDEAREVFVSGIKVGRSLFGKIPEDVVARRLLSDIIGRSAAYHAAKGDFENSLTAASESREILQDDPSPVEGDFEHHRMLGLAHRLVGAVKTRTGDYSGAIANFEKALAEFEMASTIDPANGRMRWLFAKQFISIGRMLGRTGRDPEALVSSQTGIELLEKLATEYPMSRRYRRDIADAYASQGVSLWSQKNYSDALEAYFQSLSIREGLQRDSPQEIQPEVKLGRIHHNIALTYVKMDESELAEEHYQMAIKVGESVCDKAPDQPRYLSDLSRYHSGLASLFVLTGRPGDALTILKQSLELAEAKYANSPQVVELTIAIQDASAALGELLLDTGSLDESTKVLNRSIEVGEKTLSHAKDHQSIIRQLAACNQTLGQVYFLGGKHEAARDAFQTAREYAVNDEKRFVIRLQLAQIDVYRGQHKKLETLVTSIPEELLKSSGRVNLELAGLFAARFESKADPQQGDESSHQDATACIRHLKTAQSLGIFGNGIALARIENYPTFKKLKEESDFVEWRKTLLKTSPQSEK